MLLNKIRARKIKDSRGKATIEVSINGKKASAPSGKSTSKSASPLYRKSLAWNIKFLNSFKPNIQINSFSDLKKLESALMKKTRIKDIKKFGANALMALEVAVLKALAKEKKKELWQIINSKARKFPVPLGNVVGGGLHSHNKSKPVFQEFLIIPQLKSPKKNYQLMKATYKKIKSIVKAKGKNDEGAWQTSLRNEQILQRLTQLKDVRIGIDAAASSFYKGGSYHYRQRSLGRKIQIQYMNQLIKAYKLFYVEDPLDEKDFHGFSKISKKTLVTGDDLTASQIPLLKKAIREKSINAMIIKPNQNGSLLEIEKVFKLCRKHNIKTILSHRSGETLDTALADLAFGFQADYIKTGIATNWRKVKLKRLIAIEKSLKR